LLQKNLGFLATTLIWGIARWICVCAFCTNRQNAYFSIFDIIKKTGFLRFLLFVKNKFLIFYNFSRFCRVSFSAYDDFCIGGLVPLPSGPAKHICVSWVILGGVAESRGGLLFTPSTLRVPLPRHHPQNFAILRGPIGAEYHTTRHPGAGRDPVDALRQPVSFGIITQVDTAYQLDTARNHSQNFAILRGPIPRYDDSAPFPVFYRPAEKKGWIVSKANKTGQFSIIATTPDVRTFHNYPTVYDGPPLLS